MEGAFRRLGGLATRYRWPILGAWLVAALLLNTRVPRLGDVIKQDTVPFLPDNAAVMQAYRADNQAFSAGADARGFAIVVLENGRGISAADEAFYAQLTTRLKAERPRVVSVQDYLAHPELRSTVRSRDNRSIYIPVGLRSPVGSAEGDSDAPWLRRVAAQGKPTDLAEHVTGDTAIISDFQTSIQDSTARTTAITVLLVLVILLLIYRSPVTPIIPLTTIGIALMVTRPLVALLGLHVMKVASFTDTFILAIVFGAGTDYCIFMISRFKEQRSRGEERTRALRTSVLRVGEAITCSAATVIVGGLAMLPANVSLFSTTGPAIAVSVLVTLVAGLTLTPALMAVGGDRFFWPKRPAADRPGHFWTAAAALIAARPRRVAVIALLPLLLLAALYPTMAITFNERGPQPATNDSMLGLTALGRHFQPGEVLPDYVLVQSNHDMRNPRDIATLDAVTASLLKVGGVSSVRSFTQPNGARLPQASVPYQAGVIGSGLDRAAQQLRAGGAGATRLQGGAQSLAHGALQVSGGAQQAQTATGQLAGGLGQENIGLQNAVAGLASAGGGATQLQQGAAQLATSLGALRAGVAQAVSGMDQVLLYFNVDRDPGCTLPPNGSTPCQDARRGLQAIASAERNQVLPGLDQAIAGARAIASGDGSLAGALGQIQSGLRQADAGVQQLQSSEQELQQQLGQLSGGAQQLSGGAAQLAGGAGQLTSGTAQLSSGLAQASSYLNGLSRQSSTPGISAFYVPADQLGSPQLALARYYYLSPDGRTARFLVFGRDDPFGDTALQRVDRERAAATAALTGTALAGSPVLLAGDAPLNANLSSFFAGDFRFVAIAVMLGVLLVLVLLLRSLLAPLYLLVSVLLSYAAAMGVTTLVWQDLLHNGAIDWTVGIFAFMMLVSVGADYNIFLMSRVREEVRRDPVRGIQNAVARTGAIITSAGVIFAGTFAALIASPLVNIAETGFAITCGLLLDTFIVRSFLVPSVAVMLGRWNWWPRRDPARRRSELPGALWNPLPQQPGNGRVAAPQEAGAR